MTTRVCKVCGKEYEYCYTLRKFDGIFRWQDVACSEEHGSIYLKQIMESRGEAKPAAEKVEDKECASDKEESVAKIADVKQEKKRADKPSAKE